MANALYDKGREAFLDGSISWTSDTIKVALVSSGYTPSLGSDQFYSDLGSNIVGTDQTLTSKTATSGVANAGNPTWPTVISGVASYIILYKSTGVDSTSPLIACIDTATALPVTATGGDITISWDTGDSKIFKLGTPASGEISYLPFLLMGV